MVKILINRECENIPILNNETIYPFIGWDADECIEINKINFNTYLYLMQRLDPAFKDKLNNNRICLNEVNFVHNNGDIGTTPKAVLFTLIGFQELITQVGVPKFKTKTFDATEYVKNLFRYELQYIRNIGYRAELTMMDLTIYEKNRLCEYKTTQGLKYIGIHAIEDMCINIGLIYRKWNIDIVVVFRETNKTIAIYGNPEKNFQALNTIHAGIPFEGKPFACGTKRGAHMTYENYRAVMKDIEKKY